MADVAVNQHQTMCLQINFKFTTINMIKLSDNSLGGVLFQEVVERISLKERNIATVVDILWNSCCHIIITTEITDNLTFQRALKWRFWVPCGVPASEWVKNHYSFLLTNLNALQFQCTINLSFIFSRSLFCPFGLGLVICVLSTAQCLFIYVLKCNLDTCLIDEQQKYMFPLDTFPLYKNHYSLERMWHCS